MLHDKRNKKSLSPEVFRFMGLDDYGLPRYQRWNSLWNVWIYTSMVPTKRISKVLTYEDTCN